MSRALFISLDGLDGTGKSTQCRLLAEWLRGQGREVTECVDPGSTSIGQWIRGLLLDQRQEMTLTCEALLFMASRAQLTSQVIWPALEAGRVVVCDRFLLANVVYQGHAGGLSPGELWEVGRFATGGLEPDLTIVLDLPLDIARQRRTGPVDRVESRDADYHQRVREGFLQEATRSPETMRVVNAGRSVEIVHREICTLVGDVLSKGSPSSSRD